MKLTKICPGCKWEYPLSYNKNKCRFCGTEFSVKFCNGCKQLLPMWKFSRTGHGGSIQSQCNECFARRRNEYFAEHTKERREKDKRFIEKHFDAATQAFEEWKAKTDLPFKMLTEKQWLKACSYFKGCAICGTEHIEIRQFFVNFKHGGRYTAWNVYPMCGKCAVHTRRIENPFIWLDRYLGFAVTFGLTEPRARRLVKYLQLQIDEVVEENESKQ